MATINQLKSANDAAIRNKVAPNSITTADVSDRLDALANELQPRGLLLAGSTATLATMSRLNGEKVMVSNTGIFVAINDPTPPDMINTFPSADAGWIWVRTVNAGGDLQYVTTLGNETTNVIIGAGGLAAKGATAYLQFLNAASAVRGYVRYTNATNTLSVENVVAAGIVDILTDNEVAFKLRTQKGRVKVGDTEVFTLGALAADPAIAGLVGNGAIYYNTSTNKFRGVQNGTWIDLVASVTGGLETFTATAGQTVFNTVGTLPAANEKVFVFRNGVHISFTKIGNAVTVVATDDGDEVVIRWFN